MVICFKLLSSIFLIFTVRVSFVTTEKANANLRRLSVRKDVLTASNILIFSNI